MIETEHFADHQFKAKYQIWFWRRVWKKRRTRWKINQCLTELNPTLKGKFNISNIILKAYYLLPLEPRSLLSTYCCSSTSLALFYKKMEANSENMFLFLSRQNEWRDLLWKMMCPDERIFCLNLVRSSNLFKIKLCRKNRNTQIWKKNIQITEIFVTWKAFAKSVIKKK